MTHGDEFFFFLREMKVILSLSKTGYFKMRKRRIKDKVVQKVGESEREENFTLVIKLTFNYVFVFCFFFFFQ